MRPTVIVGVSAGIAAYKAAILVRELIRARCDVRVVPTPASLEFVGKATWEGLTGHPVHTGLTDHPGSDHVELARIADLIVIAPATADVMARIRAGFANDLLTTTVLASRCPVVLSPAMHTAMWDNAATQDNVAVLRQRGITIIDPASGALGSGDHGVGRLPEPEEIARVCLDTLASAPTSFSSNERVLFGRHIVVTAGGTQEPLDPVRFIGNRSSGRQGIEIARSSARMGATVHLIASNVEKSLLDNLEPSISLSFAPTAHDVELAVQAQCDGADALVMCAAIADFRPTSVADAKIKKTDDSSNVPTIELERTTDILATIAHSDSRPPVVVGFAAETGQADTVLAYGKEKARRKGADFLAINRVGDGFGFGDVDTHVTIVDSKGELVGEVSGSKARVADFLTTTIAQRLATIGE